MTATAVGDRPPVCALKPGHSHPCCIGWMVRQERARSPTAGERPRVPCPAGAMVQRQIGNAMVQPVKRKPCRRQDRRDSAITHNQTAAFRVTAQAPNPALEHLVLDGLNPQPVARGPTCNLDPQFQGEYRGKRSVIDFNCHDGCIPFNELQRLQTRCVKEPRPSGGEDRGQRPKLVASVLTGAAIHTQRRDIPGFGLGRTTELPLPKRLRD